jgi:hypothetical protein
MGGNFSMSRKWTVVGAAALAILGSGQAMAGCGMPGGNGRSPANWHGGGGGSQGFGDSIVGLWKVTFTSDGSAYPGPIPAGVETDFGTVQWHSDGTEFMISGGRAPSTGDTCMGVWKRTGARTYKLNHLALAWASGDSSPAASPAAFLGPAVFSETVTLSLNGASYEGPFTIDQYAADGTTLLEHIGGTVKGTRMTAD